MKLCSIKLCSACLLGVKCRYDGKSRPCQKVIDLAGKETLIPVCPEQLAGLPTPRIGHEIKCNKVINEKGNDATPVFQKGAQETLKIAKIFGIKEAIFKQRSPSCGCGYIYDGTFSKKVIAGDGWTTRLLKKNGIKVISEDDL